jgi:hypothetical protein
LSARLPTRLPILGASATAPYHVIKDILANLRLPDDCAQVEVSNEKLNVFLSVCILQQEPESLADLLVLFPDDGEGRRFLADFDLCQLPAGSREDSGLPLRQCTDVHGTKKLSSSIIAI